MNRRQFLAGAAALSLVQVGAVERFLVGRYGAPVEVEWIDPTLLLGAAAFVFGVFMKEVKGRRAINRVAMKMLAPAVAGIGEKL